MPKPLISVVMTSFNYERFIPYAIESVLNQTVHDIELIIVDDGSSDASRCIIEEYRERDSRIRTLFHTRNRGISKTMNDGFAMAEGTFVATIASDDVWKREKLQKQLDVLAKDEDLVVWSEGLVIDASGSPTGRKFTQIVPDAKACRKSGDIFEDILVGNVIFGSSRIVKKENLEGIRWNESLRYLNDHQFAVDLAFRYDFFFIETPLACYRIHGHNTQTRDPAGFIRELKTLYGYFLERYGKEISWKKRYELRVRYYREMARIDYCYQWINR
jgi:glycosyltransferase involved in cell wall biosynthesis